MITLLTTALITFSCGLERDQGSRSPASGVGEALRQSSRELTATEEGIATRICYAFRNKRLNFGNIHLNDSYNVIESSNDCSNVRSSDTSSATISTDGSGLYFSESGNVSFRIETDIAGYLKTICAQLTKGEKAQNLESINGETLFYSFNSLNGVDEFGVQIALSSPLNTLNTVRLAHEYKVLTSGSNSKTLGLVTEYTRTSICSSNSNATNSMTRTVSP